MAAVLILQDDQNLHVEITPLPRKQVKKRVRSSTDKEASKSKKSKRSKADPHEEYLVAARGIARCIDLFCKVDKLIKIGCLLQQEEAADKGELDESEAEKENRRRRLSAMSLKTRDRYTRNYQQLLHLAPSIRSLINDRTKARELTKVTQKDTMLRRFQSDGGLKPAIYNGNPSRSHLGVNHPVLASYLCPVSRLAEFNRDPAEGQKKLASGGIRLTANDFPAFLWSGNPPGSMTEGLLQGYLIERVMRHIFTGLSTALGQDSRATRTCNAMLHDMTTVEAKHIAYACVQARFGISAQNKWSDIDGNFNYPEFYHNIIDFIRDCGDTDWVGELKKWWNMSLFKNEAGREGGSEARPSADEYGRSSLGSMDSLARMRAQVAARGSTTAKSSAVPAVPVPPPPPARPATPPPPARPVTPPPSSPAAIRAESLPPTPLPLPPPPARSPPPSNVASSSRKSPALSDLTDDEDALNDITNRKSKRPAAKTHSKRKGKNRRIEDSGDEEAQQPAKRARKQTCRR
ncbi:hypothetical protein EV424DRAFT_1346463 [Suillus variegatus]|nr:hypothetical protein EV424DRAFT_1346463 [Suillus variegatus]